MQSLLLFLWEQFRQQILGLEIHKIIKIQDYSDCRKVKNFKFILNFNKFSLGNF